MRQPAVNRFPKRTALVLITILVLGLLPLPVTEAATTVAMGATLPSPRDATSAVGTDDGIYIFGGRGSSPSLQILHYDPLTDSVTLQGATLPSGRSGTTAVWDGQYAYVIGGAAAAAFDQIVRFDPATDSAQVMAGKLPSARSHASSVWTGQYVYIFGGSTSASSNTDEIVRYDPATDTVTSMAATLPTARYGTSAVWDGQYAYVFGGNDITTNTRHDSIVRYDPATDSVTTLTSTLPSARYHTSAVVREGVAQVFGGYGCPGGSGNYCDEIVDVDLAGDVVSTNATTLTTGRLSTSAAMFGRDAYIFGGTENNAVLDEILRHGPIGSNTPPVLDAIANAAVQATSPLSLAFSASDADHEALAFTASGLPSGATFVDGADGTAALDWTPTRAQEGDHNVTISVSDGTDAAQQTFTISVTEGPDRPPVLDAITNRSITAGNSMDVGVSATDPDGDAITLSMSGPATASFVDDGDGTGNFTWTPGTADEGLHTVVITASAAGVNVTGSFTVNVSLDPNTAPIMDAVDDATVYAGELLQMVLTASDPEGDALTLGLTGKPAAATFDTATNGTAWFNWTPTAGDVGTLTLTFTATDGEYSNSTDFAVTVLSGTAPRIDALDDLTAAEGDSLTVSVHAFDPDGSPMTIWVDPQPLPIGATFTDHGDGNATLSWEVPHSAAGVHFFTVSAYDGAETASESFEVTVTDVPAPPVFLSTFEDLEVAVGATASASFSAEDPDGTPVVLSATGLPAGASFVDGGAGTGTLTWSNAGPRGTYAVTIHATSAGETTTGVQTIEVIAPYSFSIVPVTPSFSVASPGEQVMITLHVANTGGSDDTYTFTTSDISPNRVNMTTPAPLFVAAGTSATTSFLVNLTEDAGRAIARVSATSSGDPSLVEQRAWAVDVPVVMEVVLSDATPTVAEGSAANFGGVVQFRWLDGSVADNISFTATHTWLDMSQTSESFAADSGRDGEWTFGMETSPRFGLPGDHTLKVTATHGGFSHTVQVQWLVSPA